MFWEIRISEARNPLQYNAFSFHAEKRLATRKQNLWEQRVAQAHTRRQTLLSERRKQAAKFLTVLGSGNLMTKAAASLIQAWWKRVRLQRQRLNTLYSCKFINSLRAVAELYDADEINQIDFDTFSSKLCSRPILLNLQCLFHMLCQHPRLKPYSIREIKKLASSFIIDKFPSVVLGTDDTNICCQRLLEISRLMVSQLRKLDLYISASAERKSIQCMLLFRQIHKEYCQRFEVWKKADALKIKKDLKEAFQRINTEYKKAKSEKIRQEAKGLEPNRGVLQFIEGFHSQLEVIEGKLKHIMTTQEFSEWKDYIEFCNIDEMISWKVRQVYELMRDPNYKIQKHITRTQVKSSAILTEQLQKGEYTLFLMALTDIRDRLIALTPNRKDLIAEVQERVDIALIQGTLQKGVFTKPDLVHIIHFIFQRISALQAPSRNKTTSEKFENLEAESLRTTDWRTITAPALDRVLNELSNIELDMANFKLRLLAGLLTEYDESLGTSKIGETRGITFIHDNWKKECMFDLIQEFIQRDLSEFKVNSSSTFSDILKHGLKIEAMPNMIQLFEKNRFTRILHIFKQTSEKTACELYYCKYADAKPAVRQSIRTSVEPKHFIEKHFQGLGQTFLEDQYFEIHEFCNEKLLSCLQKSTQLSKSIFFPYASEVTNLSDEFTQMVLMTELVFGKMMQEGQQV